MENKINRSLTIHFYISWGHICHPRKTCPHSYIFTGLKRKLWDVNSQKATVSDHARAAVPTTLNSKATLIKP